MNSGPLKTCCFLPIAIFACLSWSLQASAQSAQNGESNWNQWGGPNRNFRLPAVENLADSWGANGPKQLWKREIGGGHSGIATSEDRILTTIREAGNELDVALDATTGKTIWSEKIEEPEVDLNYGMGPFATPLIRDKQVILFGGNGKLRSRDIETGKLNWLFDCSKELKSLEPDNGHACSPLLVGNQMILQFGAADASIVAFDISNGKRLWSRHNFKTDYASPIAVDIGEGQQIICHMEEEVVGLDPGTGDMIWRFPSKSRKTQHVISPIQIGDERILASTTYSVQAYQLTAKKPERLWESRGIRSQVGNLIYLPSHDMIIGAAGASTGSPVTALDAQTGEMLWRSRNMECGFLWSVGERLFCWTRDGVLIQGIASRTGLKKLSGHRVFFGQREVWSAPGIRGSRVFVKTEDAIAAFDLASEEKGG